ncbi:uroporphyrin-III C-methyltransferase [Halobacillus andaensis]|uniref:Uroporphyrinogen-III C-methyltransferase n=1 Tax=Halobacillus andaensis TaxID=1176239 RepID=A0A917EYS6_HALAA|nr:uroporphyrinogen-III C-methyltransferase [Halobacillus andaensis]MBP2005791.1 uroporphyrin-III C-methyltransferase [Halobacillus andaensis]GGF26040.1 uroporphyrin-III C-methyltransferase [Halobacillus andaensis]
MAKVYLVGAGPGDPGLITVKGMKAIERADVILYDRLVNEELLEYASKGAQLIFCGKQPDQHTLRQENINELLWQYAKKNKVVTRLKGGDPFIFGRGGEEAAVLSEKGIEFEIIPGITSGSAAPAYAGIPLTHRELSSSVTFVSGVNPQEDVAAYWTNLARHKGTLCIYMGVKKFPHTCEQLITHGMDPDMPVAIIHWGTTQEQKTVTGTLASIHTRLHEVSNPSMIVIGEVVRLRESLQWFEKEPQPIISSVI